MTKRNIKGTKKRNEQERARISQKEQGKLKSKEVGPVHAGRHFQPSLTWPARLPACPSTTMTPPALSAGPPSCRVSPRLLHPAVKLSTLSPQPNYAMCIALLPSTTPDHFDKIFLIINIYGHNWSSEKIMFIY